MQRLISLYVTCDFMECKVSALLPKYHCLLSSNVGFDLTLPIHYL